MIAGQQVVLTGTVDVRGGDSGSLAGGTKVEGGGGGGGRIALYYDALTNGGSLLTAGGVSGNASFNGLAGTAYDAGADTP